MMGLYDWSEEYSTGNSMMDTQHKKWFTYVGNLHNAMQEGKGKEILTSLLTELIAYTQTHFKAEEALLAKYNYPGLAAQLSEHEKFTRVILDLQEKNRMGQAALTVTTSKYLKDWLVEHIKGMDMKYKPYLTSKGEM